MNARCIGWLAVAGMLACGSEGPSARVTGGRLLIRPLGVSLAVPRAWLPRSGPAPATWRSCLDGPDVVPILYTSPEDLASLRRRPLAGYDVEYAAVVDGVLPAAGLVAHLGADRWGRGRCWNGLQMRAYVLDRAAPEDVRGRALRATARTAAGEVVRPDTATLDSAGWRLTRLEWTSPHADFIGSPRVEFFARDVGGRTLVLVFMYMGQLAQAQRVEIFESIRLADGQKSSSRSPNEALQLTRRGEHQVVRPPAPSHN